MKLTRIQLKQLIKESLESEGLFDSMFSSGEWSAINQAIHLAEDMGMDIMELPWELVSPDKDNDEMNIQLADLVMEKVPFQVIVSIFHRFPSLYQSAKNWKKYNILTSKIVYRDLGPMALAILKTLKRDQQSI